MKGLKRLDSPRPVLRIAVLECDEPRGETKAKYGRFGNVFRELLDAGASTLAMDDISQVPELRVSGYDVVSAMEYPRLDSVDAVLLTGSRYDSFESGQDDWILNLVKFITTILEGPTGIKVMGVCFGHQIIGRALGVMPQRNNRGWEVAVTTIELSETGQKLFGQSSLAIHQMHRDIVPFHPPNVEPVGRSMQCEVQGLYFKGRLLSLQGHPEFNRTIVDVLLDARRGTVLDESTYRSGKGRAGNEHDGVLVAAGFVKFMLNE